MQDRAELHKALARQRESVQQEVKILKSSLAKATSVFALATLISSAVFHDAQSDVKKNDLPEVSAVHALEAAQPLSDRRQRTSDSKPPPQTDKKKTLFARGKAASQRQWGPSLLMPEPGTSKPHLVFDRLVKEQQENLLTLGFDVGKADGFKGARTRQAMAEFRALYLPQSAQPPADTVLATIVRNYANLVRNDAGRFGIDHGVVAAIRLSSVRTGVDFSYLMKLAHAESYFEPASESASSSATGLYQFTRDTWLNVLKLHGAKYGLAGYAENIEYYVTRNGYRRPMVRDNAVYEHLLALRKNPRIAAMMAAESVRDNQHTLATVFEHEPTQAELYLTHFLGADGAITFLKSRQQNPDTLAVELFPEAADSNRGIFRPKSSDPATIDEVYELFGEKFSTRRYDDLAVN